MIALHSGWIDAKPSSPRSTRNRGSETTVESTFPYRVSTRPSAAFRVTEVTA
jgi:hypothetical protein